MMAIIQVFSRTQTTTPLEEPLTFPALLNRHDSRDLPNRISVNSMSLPSSDKIGPVSLLLSAYHIVVVRNI